MAAAQVAHDILQHLENMGAEKQSRHKQLSYNNLLRQFQLRVTKPKHGEAWCRPVLCFNATVMILIPVIIPCAETSDNLLVQLQVP